MGAKGWGVPTWPAEYGGGGLTAAEARVLQGEMQRIGAFNPIGGMGVGMFGPTLLEYGNEAQIAEHIPRIARGEVRWCQGFSEPGSGSDLASLSTRAEDQGDHFLINGQKIWTSGAQFADMCFCLVRTDPKAKKHEGISFLMIDMHQPGVEARPIRLINDTTPFCETFFTDAKTPKANLVGPLNGGCGPSPSASCSSSARASARRPAPARPARACSPARRSTNWPAPTSASTSAGGSPTATCAPASTSHLMDSRAHALTGERIALEAKSNRGPTAASSIMKNAGTMLRKERAELAVEIMGQQGIGWGGEAFTEAEVSAIKVMLRSKSGTIAGGSQEVQEQHHRPKRIRGLPDTTQST